MSVSLQLQTLKVLANARTSGQYSGRTRDGSHPESGAIPTNNMPARAERS